MTARVIQVIETTLALRGTGRFERDPIRAITQYWTPEGVLLAEVDPVPAPDASNYVEAVARAVYDQMPYDGQDGTTKPLWINGGNADKQSLARQIAKAALNLDH